MSYVNILVLFISWFWVYEFGSARRDITTTQSLRGMETLESSNAIFKFGFFSPINSTYRYVGIWYTKEVAKQLKVVWVANRNNPLSDSSGVLKISGDGNLQLLDGKNKSIWSSNISGNNKVNSSVAQLLDSGNLVLSSSGNIIWQSFDHPTDSMLQNMYMYFDENSTISPLVTSWKSASNPSDGRFTVGINHRWLYEVFIWDGVHPYWRSGPWNGQVLMGIRAMYYFAQVDGFSLENDNGGTVSISVSSTTKRLTNYFVLTYDGRLLQKDWQDDKKDWKIEWNSLESECDIYGKCGEFGSCNSNSLPICSCLRGFQPRNDQEWSAGNWSSGCVRRTPLQCANIGGEDDGFSRLRNVKVPDNAEWLESYDEEDCRRKCLGNCSCLAYAYTLGFGCMIWNGSLIDIQSFAPVGPDIFIRLAQSELGKTNQQKQQPKQAKTRKRKIILLAMVIIGITTAAVIMYFVWRWMRQRNGVMRITSKETLLQNTMLKGRTSKAEVGDLPVFGLKKLAVATDNFQDSNKLGRGGFGTVYKGNFEDGQEIAVKRLSKASGQGLEEIMTEVLVISKLQHRNLVKLLGCCVEGEEKMLVYELMPNKSLDALLFDPTYQKILDWKKRLNIILGICRGLLYLHRDSRLRIIHRDLKASNILLDGNLNPKISDFGMARIFGGNQDQGDTNRIVGTYGYMSPEYAMEGRFSEKSDVFSFGVLLLEVVSGRRNSSFKDEECLSLLGHAWNLWNEDNILSLIDSTISENSESTRHAEILKCIQLGLLCVQEVPEDRLSVSMFISMI